MSEEELVKEYQEGNFTVLDELAERFVGVVRHIAKRYFGIAKKVHLEFGDLEQEGWIGFLSSLDTFQFNHSTKFSTWAFMKIKYSIMKHLNSNICRIKKNDFSSEPIKIKSTSDFIPGTNGLTLEDFIIDESSELSFANVEEEIDLGILRKDIYEILYTVFGKSTNGVNGRDVLILRYGLEGKAMTLDDIGELYNLTKSTIQEVEHTAIRRIRKSKVGQAFMKKYRWKVFISLDQKKEQLNPFASPEEIVEKIESIDELLVGILKQCC